MDDDALVLELHRRKLVQGGFEVQTAEEGLLTFRRSLPQSLTW